MVVVFAVKSDGGEIVYVGASRDPRRRLARLRWERVRHAQISEWLRSLDSPPELVVLDETETLPQGRAAAMEWRRRLGVDETHYCRRMGWLRGRPRRGAGRT